MPILDLAHPPNLGQQPHSAGRALPLPGQRDPLPIAHFDQLPHILPGQRNGRRGQTAALQVRVRNGAFSGRGDGEWKQVDRIRDSCDAGTGPRILGRGGLQWIGGECFRHEIHDAQEKALCQSLRLRASTHVSSGSWSVMEYETRSCRVSPHAIP